MLAGLQITFRQWDVLFQQSLSHLLKSSIIKTKTFCSWRYVVVDFFVLWFFFCDFTEFSDLSDIIFGWKMNSSDLISFMEFVDWFESVIQLVCIFLHHIFFCSSISPGLIQICPFSLLILLLTFALSLIFVNVFFHLFSY